MSKITYKGFDKNFKCRDFQYEVGKSYTHKGKVAECQSGFHACEMPLNVFAYYPPADSRFATVEQSGKISDGKNKKASSEIKIKCEISLFDLVKAHIKWVSSNIKKEGK